MQDPNSRRVLEAFYFRRFEITEAQVRAARRAYFANISYLDDKIGRLLDVLARCGSAEDTVVVFCADHGDLLGERGLWFKMSFFEGSPRLPLNLAAPALGNGAGATPASTLDLHPTLPDLPRCRTRG